MRQQRWPRAIDEFRRDQIHSRSAFILRCAGRTYLSAEPIDEATSHAREGLVLTERLGARGNDPVLSAS
jgi:hypothetical protein